jgi:hypothetical protein
MVVAGAAMDGVVTAAAEESVAAAETVDDIVEGGAVDRVVAVIAGIGRHIRLLFWSFSTIAIDRVKYQEWRLRYPRLIEAVTRLFTVLVNPHPNAPREIAGGTRQARDSLPNSNLGPVT